MTSGTIISRTTIESSGHNSILDILKNKNYIADPKSGSAEQRAFVYSFDPLMKSVGFGGLPYIVLELPRLEYRNKSTDGKHQFVKHTHNLIVRTAVDGSGGNLTDKGIEDIQSIADDLNETFNSSAVKNVLRDNGLNNIKLTKDSTDNFPIDEKAVLEAQYTLEYEMRFQTSS